MNWLFLRGLVRERGHWGNFLDQFQSKFPEAKIFCLDIPGNGELFKEKSPSRIETIVDSLRPHWKARAAPQTGPSGIFSISLGGMLASDWLRRFPQDFQTACLLNSSLRGYSPIYHRLRWESFAKFLSILLDTNDESREKKILALTSNFHSKDVLTALAHIELQRRHPVTKANALRQLLAAARFRPPQMRPAKIPILVMNGGADRFVNPACSWAIAERWGAELKIHPTAGHDLPLDAPEWILDELEKWLLTINELANPPSEPQIAKTDR